MSNETKQTAVDWLVKEFNLESFQATIKLAKSREKEQIEDAYDIGFADAWDDARYEDEPTYTGAEQYYNETYRNE